MEKMKEVENMENKEFVEYQEGLEEGKKELVRKFYNSLVYQGVDLKEIDKLIIKDVGLINRYTRVIAIKNGEVIKDVVEREDRRLVGILYRQQHIIEEKTGLKIRREVLFKRERVLPTLLYEWHIDCTEII